MRRTRLAALCGAGMLFSACAGTSADDRAETDAAHTGRLCPGCVALQGGETGDFPGGGASAGEPCPSVRRVESDPALVSAAGFSAQAAIALVQRKAQLPAT